MKKFIIILLINIFLLGIAYGEATPTDLIITEYEEFEDDDFGCITAKLDRQVFLQFLHETASYTLGDEISLIAILINFLPDDEYTFVWEFSENGNEWQIIPNANDQIYTFVLNKTNAYYYWRVNVYIKNLKPINLANLCQLDEYRTPLGLPLLWNQAGDCFD